MIKLDTRFLPHNAHWDDPAEFAERDPQLRQLARQAHVHVSALLARLPRETPGIYTLGGGRQVGKTTLLKQWMSALLADGVAPGNIAFFSGELIDDHHGLLRLLQERLTGLPDGNMRYLLLDEATYIRDWDKAVKYAADAGLLEQTVLMITGSDLALIREARARFPGRRGPAAQVDFHLCPLSFQEAAALKRSSAEVERWRQGGLTEAETDSLFEEFDSYLLHGGYLTAINDIAQTGGVRASTLATYSDWIRGDALKRGKQEHYLREFLEGVIKRYGSHCSWNALARDLSIDHPKTAADYGALLQSMDALLIQPALQEDKLAPAPKKARKLMFNDPFIFHAVRAWLRPEPDPWQTQMQPLLQDAEWSARLVEACAVSHYRRYYPTYYIKGKGEVDIAYIDGGRFWPVEIKWTRQLRPKELRQLARYPQARLLARTRQAGELQGVPVEPLPLALLQLETAAEPERQARAKTGAKPGRQARLKG